ncbi:hypothetical protein M408DRAFT_332955 [Serendipita vermifera MAFF 305830]|uniref:Uncharacterized protein n=1 Tax=Serendipita vermifera MAFF 305830 TaxID=933852 RepID=A0A0C3AQQ3_SERVB|nr:hypothetical protein M408DRAFT_332955 [Serendipita vermifera MAFF 305830]
MTASPAPILGTPRFSLRAVLLRVMSASAVRPFRISLKKRLDERAENVDVKKY